jgi:hypothetical protein
VIWALEAGSGCPRCTRSATTEHPTLLVTGFVDLDRHRLVDVVQGRTAQGLLRSGDVASDLLHRELRLGRDALNGAEPHVDGSDFVRVESTRRPGGFIVDVAHAK